MAGRMDPATRTLQRAREEVLYSQEWEDLNKELFSQIQHLEYLEGRGHIRPFTTLSNREKLSTVGKATKALEKTTAYSELQRKVSSSVEHHFNPVGPYPATGPSRSAESLQTPRSAAGSDTPMRDISEACSHLLLEWPHLKCHLRNCFNRPFPPGLRASAWKVILQHSSVKKEFLAKAAERGFQELHVAPEEKRIAHRCEVLLSSNPVFYDMADSASILRAMKSVILFWNLKASTGNMITDTDLLVCIPFLYVWREELSRASSETGIGKGQNWSVVAEIAEQYISFMEMLPLTMHSVISDHTLEAMNKFSLQVEQLLKSEDQKLYRALQKMLRSPTRSHSAISQEEQLPFHKRLRNILHPHVQKMLVGDVSMEVLCYIWDQCFIGINSGPDYQCLPYFITVWLILLRENLIACHSAKSAEVILSTNSSSLTVPQFQKEIEKRFLEKLSSQLGIAPVKLGGRSRLQHKSSRPEPAAALRPTQRRELEPATGELTSGSHPPEDPEKEHLKRRVSELQMQLELEQMRMKLEQQNFSDALSKERKLHKRQMDSLIGDVEALKQKVSESVFKSRSQEPCSTGISSAPTNITLLSPLSGNAGYACVLPPASPHVLPDFSTIAGPPPAQTQSRSLRPYSPSHLTESDVQDIWLKILRRFTDAAYIGS